jgi:DNA polymerase III subunit gamma/tau
VVNCAGLENQSLSVTGKQRTVLQQQADPMSPDTIMAGLDVLVSAKNRMRYTSHGRVLLEMALVRLCRLDDLVPLSQLAKWVAGEGASSGRPRAGQSQPIGSAAVGSLASAVEKKKLVNESSVPSPQALTQESLEGIWQQVLSQVGFILANELRKISNVAIFGPNTLVVRIPPRYNSHGDQYLDGNRLAKVEAALTKIVGQPCSIRLESAALDSNDHVPVAEAAAPAPSGTAQRQRQRAEVAQVPLVGKAMDVLGGQIMQMDEDFGTQAAPTEVPEPGDVTEEG